MPYQYETNPRGHTWKKDEDGSIDIFGYEGGEYHNGPQCVVCGYGFCHHCQAGAEEDCPGKPPESNELTEHEREELSSMICVAIENASPPFSEEDIQSIATKIGLKPFRL